MNNLIDNVKDGEHRGSVSLSGFDLARKIADDKTEETENRHIVNRVLDGVDKHDGVDRMHFSFDIVEIINSEEIQIQKKKETRILQPVQLMQALVERGYEIEDDGAWAPDNDEEVYVMPEMWQYCGKSPKDSQRVWEEWMLEEVEV